MARRRSVACLVLLLCTGALGSAAPHAVPRRAPRKSYDPSLEELEGGVQRLCDAVGRFAGRVQNLFRKNRQTVLTVGGLLGLVHGGAAAFTVLFIQSFGASGWPLMQTGLRRGQVAYEEAKQSHAGEAPGESESAAPLRRKLIELAERLAELRREGASQPEQMEVIRQMRAVRKQLEAMPPSRRAAPVLVAAFEPAVLRDVALGVWSGVTVSLATACSSAVRTIGIGVSLGEVISNTANAMLAKVEPAIRKALSALPAEAVMLSYLGPSILGSASLALLGRTAGCWLAYRLQHLAAVLSVSLLSARMLVEAVAPEAVAKSGAKAAGGGSSDGADGEIGAGLGGAVGNRDSRAVVLYKRPRRAWLHASTMPKREAVTWLLAVASLQSQRARGFKLPLYLQVPLLPLLAVETLLRQLANRLTADGFPQLSKQPPRRSKPAWAQ